MKISLTKPVSGYNLAAINDNFTKLETEFQTKVMYRNNPVGEPNTFENDVDLNGNDLLNVGTINGAPISALNDISSYVDTALAAATAAAASYDSFDDRYLGAKAVDPTVDNDGNALIVGATYWNTTTTQQKTWTGSVWVPNSVPGGVVSIASGGTGSTTAAAARAAIGAAAAVAPSAFVAYRSIAQTTGSNVVFDIVVNQAGSDYSASTGLYTAPITGWYTFTATVQVTNLYAGQSGFVCSIYSGSGGSYALDGLQLNATGSGYLSQGIFRLSCVAKVTAGDTVGVTTNTLSPNLGVNGGIGTRFTGALICAA